MNQPFVLNVFQTLLSWKSVSGPVELRHICARSGFKPCCHGSRSAASRRLTARYRPIDVSNLVVMEVGQRPAALRGSGSGRRVSNLVVMEVGQRLPTPTRSPRSARKFQTLLSWKSVSGLSRVLSPPTARAVSNLVVMEVGQRPEWLYCITWGGVQGFKPCCHGSRSAASIAANELLRRPRGFKPCCHGSRSAASLSGSEAMSVHEFQTLLSWKSVSGWGIPLHWSCRCTVSNLVVMEVGQRQRRLDLWRHHHEGFKPCCHGSRSAASISSR